MRNDALFRTRWFLMGSTVALIVAYAADLVGPRPLRPIPPSGPVVDVISPPPLKLPGVSARENPPDAGRALEEPPPLPPKPTTLSKKKPTRVQKPKPVAPSPKPPPSSPQISQLERLFSKWSENPKDIQLRTRIENSLERNADRLLDSHQRTSVKRCVTAARLASGQKAYEALSKCRRRLESGH